MLKERTHIMKIHFAYYNQFKMALILPLPIIPCSFYPVSKPKRNCILRLTHRDWLTIWLLKIHCLMLLWHWMENYRLGRMLWMRIGICNGYTAWPSFTSNNLYFFFNNTKLVVARNTSIHIPTKTIQLQIIFLSSPLAYWNNLSMEQIIL